MNETTMVMKPTSGSARRRSSSGAGALIFFILNCALLVALASSDDAITSSERKAFQALRKAVNSLAGGYVHPSLGLLGPTPSGAARGLGMVSQPASMDDSNDVLLKIPIEYQMTRNVALSTLTPLIPVDVLRTTPLTELDDAALLVLLLAHEKGLGKKSHFKAYLDTLPSDGGGCGWAGPGAEDFRELPRQIEPEDIEMGLTYATRVSVGMSSDYGDYLAKEGWSKDWKEEPSKALRWALCMVSSRGTAANSVPGGDADGGTGIRLVPMADLINHDLLSAGFIELSGKERKSKGDFTDATDKDAGSFICRAAWGKDWKTRQMDKGDEVTVNYNLPHYGAVDWYLSLGFIPTELSDGRGDEL